MLLPLTYLFDAIISPSGSSLMVSNSFDLLFDMGIYLDRFGELDVGSVNEFTGSRVEMA